MINAYHEIITQEDNFEEYLNTALLVSIFEDIFIEYPNKEDCKKVVKFIAYAYSIESSKITLGGDRRTEKNNIFRYLFYDGNEMMDIKKHELYFDVVMLENRVVVKAAQEWMKFKDNTQLEYLLTLKDAYTQQQEASLNPLKKADGVSIDFDQKFKCIEHMAELKKMIRDAESDLQQNDNKLKEAFSEVKKNSKSKNTIGAEHFSRS